MILQSSSLAISPRDMSKLPRITRRTRCRTIGEHDASRRYVGLVSYKGHTKWVGTHPSVAAYKQAEQERLIELRGEVDLAEGLRVPTVMEFAGAVIHENGKITMTWPEGQRALKETDAARAPSGECARA
jgi:hypothetical protein